MRTFTFLIITLLILDSCQPKSTEQNLISNDWVSMFNGKNLDGWTVRILGKELGENFGNTFRVDSGILKIRYDEYESFDNLFGGIYFDKPFSNYRLRLEYRFVGETAPGAPEWGFRDSGVQFHSQSPQSMKQDQAFPVCLEFNLHGGNGRDERPTGQVCVPGTIVEIDGKINDSFCTSPKVKRTFHGDQWVVLEIDVQDTVISHYVNGEKIMTYLNPRYDPKHEYGNAFISEENDRVKEGFISLQSNSHPIDFRKIEILEY